MVIPIEIEAKDYYKSYIMCLNPMLKLKPREIEVLTILTKGFYQLHEFAKQGHFTQGEVYNKLLGAVGKKIIREQVNMSESSFDNHLSQLRRKKVLSADNKLPQYLTEIPVRGTKIEYNIMIK